MPKALIDEQAPKELVPETLVEGRSYMTTFSVDDDGQIAWTENPWCSNCGGVFVRRPTGAIDELAVANVAAGVATLGGTVYFGRYTDRGVRGGSLVRLLVVVLRRARNDRAQRGALIYTVAA